MRFPALALLVAAGLPLLASCGSSSSAPPPEATPDASTAKLYPGVGVVKGFQSGNKVIILHSQDIPGFMDEMTMPYELQDPALARGLKDGDAVDFTVTARGDDDIITAIRKRRP
ncbi:MAG TPA: copper-binding protein [bacterium]|jgi:Cu/Ag efflux protein CusF|nr:copper-binding protein [bacterium]